MELCLLQMCDPTLDLDAQALNARLSRLESELASGALTVRTVVPIQEQDPSPEELPDPQPAPEAAAPAASEELPVGFWADLVDATRKWRPSLGGYINTNDSNLVTPKLNGELLELSCATEMVRSIVDRDDVRNFMAQKASALLHRSVRVRFTVRDSRGGKDPINKLIEISQKHPDLFHVQ